MIISDIRSPDMDGWQFLKWVRANPFAARVRFIVVTGQTGVRHSLKAAESGANHFAGKPYDLHKLLGTIRRQFEKQEEPVWDLPALSHELIETGPVHALPWDLLVDRWLEALQCSPYRTGLLGMSDWRLDFVVDDGASLTAGRLCRPPDPTTCYSSHRYHSFLDGYGVDNGLIFVVGPRTTHLQTSPRAIIASPVETDDIFAGGIFAPDLSRFET
jgi:CheY-like chemotaxis protein